jgi:hypothetical protein
VTSSEEEALPEALGLEIVAEESSETLVDAPERGADQDSVQTVVQEEVQQVSSPPVVQKKKKKKKKLVTTVETKVVRPQPPTVFGYPLETVGVGAVALAAVAYAIYKSSSGKNMPKVHASEHRTDLCMHKCPIVTYACFCARLPRLQKRPPPLGSHSLLVFVETPTCFGNFGPCNSAATGYINHVASLFSVKLSHWATPRSRGL